MLKDISKCMESGLEARIAKVEGNNPATSNPRSAASQCKRPATSLSDGIAEEVKQKVATRMRKRCVKEAESSDQMRTQTLRRSRTTYPPPSRIQKVKDT